MNSSPNLSGKDALCDEIAPRFSGRTDLPRTTCFGLLALVVLATYGVPVILGWSWIPRFQLGPAFAKRSNCFPNFGCDGWSHPVVEAPFRSVEYQGLRDGEFPLWNPYASLGTPIAGQYQTQVFLPLEWLEICASPLVLNILFLLKIFLAGAGCFLALERTLHQRYASLAAAVFYMFSPMFVWFTSIAPFVNPAVILPWMYVAVARLWDREVPMVRSAGFLAFVVGLALLMGQPQITGYNIIFLCVYVAIKTCWQFNGASVRKLLLFLTALAVGAGIASIQLRLCQEALRHCLTLHPPQAYGTWGVNLLDLPNYLWPYLFGQIMAPWQHFQFPDWENFPVLAGACGLFLGSIGVASLLFSRRARQRLALANCAALAAIGLAILILIVLGSEDLIGKFTCPIIDQMNFPRYASVTLSFALALMVGIGASQFCVPERVTFMWGTIFMTVVIVYLACVLGRYAEVFTQQSPGSFYVAYKKYSLWLGVGPFAILLLTLATIAWRRLRGALSPPVAMTALLTCLACEGFFWLRLGLMIEVEWCRSLFVVCGCCAALALAYQFRKTAIAILAAGFAGLCGLLGSAENHLINQRDTIVADYPHVGFLQEKLGRHSTGGRVVCSQESVFPNQYHYHGIADIVSPHPVQIDSTVRYVCDALTKSPSGNKRFPLDGKGMIQDQQADCLSWVDYVHKRRFYNRLAIKYLIDTPQGYLSSHALDGIQLVYEDPQCKIFEDEQSLPRAYACYSCTVLNDFDRLKAFREVLAREREIDTRPIVEDEDGDLPTSFQSAKPAPITRLPIGELSLNHVTIPVRLDRAALVVLVDAYYPGWTALVDGRQTPTFRVNSIVRGVAVPAGEHVVEFVYRPRWLGALIWLSLGSLALSLTWLAWDLAPAVRHRFGCGEE